MSCRRRKSVVKLAYSDALLMRANRLISLQKGCGDPGAISALFLLRASILVASSRPVVL